ncbi:acyl-CoA dehydrogenase family protein [Skermanella stibiiresistens]|uniref:acyl-CoA dehydrogenase family protein n=1 Tax=Skermanella stibiiresistens TaxID=913326 RepID=UPI00068557D8|nr:acyl-CoA dehydrogenase family protein [Skermanella stibiiresistens]
MESEVNSIDAQSRPAPEAEPDISAIVLEQADRLFHEHVTPAVQADADRSVWPTDLWRAVEEAGLTLALVPEHAGGFGLPPDDALRVIRRSAWAAAPIPLAETMVAAGLWSLTGGDVPEGSLTLGPVNQADAITAERRAGGWRLDGRVRRIPWGSAAGNVLLHAVSTDGEPLVALVPSDTLDWASRRNLADEPRDRLSLSGLDVRWDAVHPAPAACRDGFLPLGALIRSQQMVGALERALDHALLHAGERRQFGRSLSKFQAVQHMLAEAAGHFAAATAAADLAAAEWSAAGGLEAGAEAVAELAFPIAVAKARTGEAAGIVAAIVHQVHGAMGFTQEHPLHYSTRRLWSWRDEFGGESHWQAEIGRLVCSRGGAALWERLAT